MRITSVDNAHYRHWKRLAESARACRESGRTLAEGIHLVEAAAAARADVQAIVLSDAAGPEARGLGEAVAAQTGCRCVDLPARLYGAIAPVEHGAGLLAEIAIGQGDLPHALDVDAVYLDGVQDPGNAGTLLRTAAAAGVRHVAAAPGTAFLWAPKVVRAAMGAHFTLSIHENVTPDQLAAAFTGERLAADAGGGESVFAAAWGAGPTVWLFGSEGSGLSAAAHAITPRRLHIPVASGVESLNVAAAAAVCLFEQRRRRG
jgi:TrmH family RNA methyltransferase